MQNSKEIFSIALGLEAPWQVSEVRFDTNNSQLDIHLTFKRGAKFQGEDGQLYSAYDTVKRSWQHLNFFQHICYLHAKVPRIKQADGKIRTQPVPWARKQSGFTLLFEAYAMLLIESEMPVNKAAELLKVYPKRLWTIFNHWVSEARQADQIEDLTTLGFDETSTKKGHNYITTMVDLDTHRVLYVSQGKGADNIEESVAYLEQKSVDPKTVKNVCIDMSPAFISGCIAHLPQAAITFDKFHLVKDVNKAMDELRKLERRGNNLLKGHKYTFLKNRLSPEKQMERDILLALYPKLGEGYRLKQLFQDFWDIKDPDQAQGYLAFWCDLASDSGIFPFQRLVNTVKAHWTGIVNYIQSKINNGVLEGINSKIQLAKKRARGYRNVENFINMIYFICGKLKFKHPLYLT